MFFYQNIMVDDTQESPYILMHRIDELLGKTNISYGILYVKYILYYSSKAKNEFLNSTAQWGDGIHSRTVDIYSFI